MQQRVDRGTRAGDQPSPSPGASALPFDLLEQLAEPVRGVPRPGTPLFGRERDLEQLSDLLTAPGARLLTILGPGGVGKTRLALEAAHQAMPHFADGVITISLATIRETSQVVPAIMRGTGLRPDGTADPLAALIAALHEQQTLLLLDNFEQVVDAAPDLARLLAACPRVVVLVTSRAPLRITVERIVRATPLGVATDPMLVGGEVPPALRLFVERARQADPSFEPDARTFDQIGEICRRLDGLPLAIELAAAHVAAVSPAELARRLDPSLPLLAYGNRDLPERQRTMRAAIAWSYELLPADIRAVFRWLSIFVGGFRLPTAEALVTAMRNDAEVDGVHGASPIEAIETLIASSLVHKVAGSGTESRYVMLEVVREFGLELLGAHEEWDAARRTHANWYATNRLWLDPNRFGPGERFIDRLREILAEHGNVLAALSRSADRDAWDDVLAIATNTSIFWHHAGYLGEGRSWLELGLANTPAVRDEAHCWALTGLGLIRWTQRDASAADSLLTEAIAIATELDHLELITLAHHVQALIDGELGRLDLARVRIQLAQQNWRQLGLPTDEAMALAILGWLPPGPNQPDLRRESTRRSLELFEATGHPSGVAITRYRLGSYALADGDERRAFQLFAQSALELLAIDERWQIARPLMQLSRLALAHQRPREGALLLGLLDARLRAASAHLTEPERELYDSVESGLSVALGPSRFTSLRHAGERLAFHDVEAILASLERQLFERSLLTEREVEVLRRIADGAIDREIADELFISPRTVNTHVSHILTKLDVSTRRAAVRRATELDLLGIPNEP